MNESQEKAETATAPTPPKQVPNLVNVKVDCENTAFNLLISFVGLAQRRGAFALDEAAKIFECIKIFKHKEAATH